jgi:hypothetical protein
VLCWQDRLKRDLVFLGLHHRNQDKIDAAPIMNVVAQSAGNVYGELCVSTVDNETDSTCAKFMTRNNIAFI